MLDTNLKPHPYANLHELLAGIRQLKALNGVRRLSEDQIKAVDTIFASFRALLKKDHELHLEDYDLILAVAQTYGLYRLLPAPTMSDAQPYHVFYHGVTAIVRSKYLAHIFEVMGNGKLGRLEFSYSGSDAEWMIPKMQSLFQRYLQSMRLEQLESNGQIVSNVDFSESIGEALREVKPIYDLKDVQLDWDKPLLLPVVVKTNDGTHVIMMAFYQNMMMVFDRSTDPRVNRLSGASIYHIPSERLDQRASAVAYIVSTQNQVGSNYVTFEGLLESCKKTLALDIQANQHIALTAQMAENCAWSSCATQAVLCLLLLEFMKQNRQDAAHAALTIFKDWLKFCMQSSLEEHLEYYRDDIGHRKHPDQRLLAKIYLQQRCTKPHHHAIREAIERSGLLSEAALHDAHKMLLRDVEHALTHVFTNTEQSLPPEMPEVVADLLMLQKRRKFQEEIQSLAFEMHRGRSYINLANIVRAKRDEAKDKMQPVLDELWLPSQGVNNVITTMKRKRC